MYCSMILLIVSFIISVCSGNLLAENPVPGHLEYDPEFQRRFPFIQPNVDSRIVGGEEVVPHSRPYQVGMIVPVSVGGTYFCGASLLDARNILTAAHCVDYMVGNLTAYLGAHRMLPASSENATVVQTDDVLVYPGWSRSTLLHDIALVRLKEPIELTARISPILLPRDNTLDYLGNTSLATGWGKPIEFTPGLSPVLNELSSHIMSNCACRLAYLGYIEESNICMASFLGRASCNGDSGGPLTVNGVQVGVLSFGSGWGCAQGFPSVFSRVTYYLEWIIQNLAPITESSTTSTTTATAILSTSTTSTISTTESTTSSTATPSPITSPAVPSSESLVASTINSPSR